jgi:hypothetical protein
MAANAPGHGEVNRFTMRGARWSREDRMTRVAIRLPRKNGGIEASGEAVTMLCPIESFAFSPRSCGTASRTADAG